MLYISILRRLGSNMNTCMELGNFRFSSGFGKRRNNMPPASLSRKKIVSKLFTPLRISNISTSSGYHTLAKPFIFTVCFSGAAYACAAVWQYEHLRSKVRSYRNNWFGQQQPPMKNFISREISAWWSTLTEGEKVSFFIIAANAVVFVMWRVPSLQPFMQAYFRSCPTMKNNCLPMILSTFSHFSFLHMVTNMYVLNSFSTSSVAFLGKEQFVALYLSSGVISSFASYVYKVITKSPGSSLGASGSLMAILSSTCLQFPHTRLSIIFLPFFTVAAGHAIKVVMALDFAGLVLKWKLFDHAAHLGGACFGIFYVYYGRQLIWDKRESLVKWWHRIRERQK